MEVTASWGQGGRLNCLSSFLDSSLPDLASINFPVEVLLEGNGDPDLTGAGILDSHWVLGMRVYC